MRTSESVPALSYFPTIERTHRDSTLHSRPDLIVLERISADLMDWIDCSWIVGLASNGRDLRVACVKGTPPDLPRCMEFVSETLRRPAKVSSAESNPRGGEIHCGNCPLDAIRVALPVIVSRIPGGHGAGQRMTPLLAIGPKNRSTSYSARDRELICDLCASVGAILGNAHLAQAMSAEFVASNHIRADFEVAQEMHDRFLPSDTAAVDGLEYYGSSQRCGALGGDFFGFLRPPEPQPHATHLVMTLGRVAPVGSPAALLAAGLQATLRTLLEYEGDLTRVLQELNRMMWEVSPGDVLSTLLCVRIDPSHRKLEYVSAGQEAGFLIRARDHRIEPLENSGAVLGLSRRSKYTKKTMALEPGDVLVALSDGIADATAPGEQHFIKTLPNLLRNLSSLAARDLTSCILDAVELFTGRTAQIADRTVTAIRMSKSAHNGVSAVAA